MPLTVKQQRVLEFIQRFSRSNYCTPTIREIGEQFGMRSSASVHQVLTVLEQAGMIQRVPNVSRGIRLVEESTPQV